MYLTTLKKSVYKTQHKENKRQNINMRTIHDKRVVFLTYAILQINFKNSCSTSLDYSVYTSSQCFVFDVLV